MSVAKPENLRDAGSDYPGWVSENYLQLPTNFPRRIRLLSQQVTAGVVNPYDKAVAIRDYLKTFPYSLNVKAPPSGRDGVDYFLFSQKTGYCDYYASAMVTMLRSVGVPARFVVGYATGEWDSAKKLYVVRELQYHSWVETYFPAYGWVEFEPTPPDATEFTNQPPLSMPTSSDSEGDAGATPLEDESPEEIIGSDSSVFGWLIMGSILMAILLLAIAWYRWWGRLVSLGYQAEIYSKMCRLGSLAQQVPEPQFTPLEYAQQLSMVMPNQAKDIKYIAESYGKTRYGRRKFLLMEERDRMEQTWRRLRRALLVQVIRRKKS